jgi:hypothetical protein
MSRLPTFVYRLAVHDEFGKLRWSEVGSKTYNSEKEALKRLDNLRSRGIDCDLYRSSPLQWTLISEDD